MIAAIYLHGPLSAWWFRFSIEGTASDYSFAVIELIWGMTIGVAIALLVRSARFMAWALGCGILGALYL
ncbi:MAG TPA: hypothetical protein VH301_16245, partial [Usitatibacter sp.]|nr:hypothetical protein [Usitatibacter sp.]